MQISSALCIDAPESLESETHAEGNSLMKLKLIIVVAAALSVAALSAGCASEKKEKTPSQKEQAVRQWNQTRGAVVGQLAKNQYEAGNFEESRKSIEQAVKLDPQNS